MGIRFFVAKLGLEPRQTEPESVVLPLHHLAITLYQIHRKGTAFFSNYQKKGKKK